MEKKVIAKGHLFRVVETTILNKGKEARVLQMQSQEDYFFKNFGEPFNAFWIDEMINILQEAKANFPTDNRT
jgi:hypothetical protein